MGNMYACISWLSYASALVQVMVLRKFSLSVPAGSTAALVGESGSGKSTVIGLIERFYDPLKGQVRAQPVRHRSLVALFPPMHDCCAASCHWPLCSAARKRVTCACSTCFVSNPNRHIFIFQVLLDGIDIKNINLHWLRSHVALVSQEPVLFTASVLGTWLL